MSSKRANPYTDGLARNAMGLIAKNIRTACAEPDNRAAREAMMLGATTAGMAFSNASVALVHGMSRPIGAFFHVPHGLSNAMLLPEITAFSAPAALDRYADCARAMGVAEEGEGSQAAVARLLDALRGLNDDLKVPSPKAYGIAKERYDELLPTMAAPGDRLRLPGQQPPRAVTGRDHRRCIGGSTHSGCGEIGSDSISGFCAGPLPNPPPWSRGRETCSASCKWVGPAPPVRSNPTRLTRQASAQRRVTAVPVGGLLVDVRDAQRGRFLERCRGDLQR